MVILRVRTDNGKILKQSVAFSAKTSYERVFLKSEDTQIKCKNQISWKQPYMQIQSPEKST